MNRKIGFVFIAILVLVLACITTEPIVLEEYEQNKEIILKEYYAPETIDGKMYKYIETKADGKTTNFYISYKFIKSENTRILEITDYDNDLNKVGFKELELFDDHIRINKYIIYGDNGNYENIADIQDENEYSVKFVFKNYKFQEISILRYSVVNRMIDCRNEDIEYQDSLVNVFIISYEEENKIDSMKNKVRSKAYFAKNICIIRMEYFDQSNKMLLKRELTEIKNTTELFKNAA